MKILLYAIFMIVSVSAVAQQDTIFNQTNANGKKTGWWKKTYEDGTPLYIAKFEDGKPVGTVKRYAPNGKLSSVLTYISGSDSVDAQIYNANGILLATGKYFKMKKTGEWKTFHASGALLYLENYKQGIKDGKSLGYYADGQKMFDYNFSNGLKVGYAVQYHPNGAMMEELRFSESGKPNSLYRAYYDTNAARITGKYVDGEKEGTWTTFNEDGSVNSKVEYKNGHPQVTDEMLKKETEMMNSYTKMKGRFEEPNENNIMR